MTTKAPGFDPTKHIMFTQYVRPHGLRRPTWIERPEAVLERAKAIIEKGGVFEIEDLGNGSVSMDVEHKDFEYPVAIEICKNGHQILDAVDRLVEAAYRRLIGAEGRRA